VQAVLATAFAAVLELHLDRATPAELGLWTLRGLEVLDPALHTEVQSGTLLLSASDRLLAARAVPSLAASQAPQQAAGPLAIALSAMFGEAWRASPVLRRAGVERVLRSGFEELFNHLDPYSRYLSPEEAEAARARRVGQSGLGLRLAAGRGSEVRIATLTPDGPAAQAGLRVQDRLLAVDGTSVQASDLGAAAALLEGPADSAVMLRIERGGRRFEVRLLRSPAAPRNLAVERRGDILWLRLEGFSGQSDARLAEALGEAFRATPPRGVVLDLRGNRGGLLAQAVAVASVFLDDGIVARTAGRHPDAARTWLSTGPDVTEGTPLVVLVDGRTASSAEIVAAALADRGRAAVVGSVTTGKGLIQAVIPLPNGGELLLTWSRVLAPRGWPIQALGVLPMLCTSLGAEATAAELAALRNGEAPMARPLARLRAARAPVPASEVAALRNACPPAEGREADLAAARALIETPQAYRAALGR